jgi:hypothetical protein
MAKRAGAIRRINKEQSHMSLWQTRYLRMVAIIYRLLAKKKPAQDHSIYFLGQKGIMRQGEKI